MAQSLDRTATSEWIARRAAAVRSVYSAFDVLMERGYSEHLTDSSTPVQLGCPFHGADNRPSARYYPRTGIRSDYVRCFKCNENWDSVNLVAKFSGVRFMDALAALERRFGIRVPRRPEDSPISDPAERGSGYVSDQWRDVPRMLSLLESKVVRARDRCGMEDYVRFCRVLDAVAYDYDKSGAPTPDMVAILHKLRDRVDEVVSVSEAMREFDTENAPPG